MTIIELLEESIEVFQTNKMRTVLSALGIIIGIGSVIALMTLGKATQQSTIERISSLGSNMLTIRPGSSNSGFLGGQSGDSTNLTYDDMKAIGEEKRITSIDLVAAEYSSNAQVAFERTNERVTISGVTPEFFEIRNIELNYGVTISESDMELQNRVVILGSSTASDLFGNSNPIGQNIKINGYSYRVIGVAKEKGSAGRFNTDETVYIPLSTAQKNLFGVNHVSTIYVRAKSQDVMEIAKNQVGYFLLEKHKLSSPVDADFSISSSSDLIETVSEITGTFTSLLTGIAAISLVVGGIGIMNIMLVTVTERTREIGIRKALGAKRKTIIAQFLVESIILAIVGGVFGVIIGLLVSNSLTKYMNLPSVVSIESIGLAVLVSCAIGIIFGWYPAQKAAKLQPIEALRYE